MDAITLLTTDHEEMKEMLGILDETTERGIKIRTELFAKMYAQPVHPPNLWLEQDPLQHEAVDHVYRANIERLVERGAFTPPANAFPGCRFLPPSRNPADADWENVKQLWADE